MWKALIFLVALLILGIGVVLWLGSRVVAPTATSDGGIDTDINMPNLGVKEKVQRAGEKISESAKSATALLDRSVKSLKCDKDIVEIKPGEKAEAKIARVGGDLKALKLEMKTAPDSKLLVTGGEFKDGEQQATVTIEAQADIRSDSAITISTGNAKLILPVRVK